MSKGRSLVVLLVAGFVIGFGPTYSADRAERRAIRHFTSTFL